MLRLFVLAVALFALSSAVTVSSASAQAPSMESNHLISVGLGGGVSVPVSDAKDAFKNGFNGQGFVKLNLGGLPISPRLDFTFQSFDLKNAQTVGGGPVLPSTSGTGTVLAGVANLQFPLMRGRFQPYLVAGLGAYNVKTKLDDTASAEGAETSETKFGINGGAGATLQIAMFKLYAEGRVDNVYTDKGVIDQKSIQVVPVTFGIVY